VLPIPAQMPASRNLKSSVPAIPITLYPRSQVSMAQYADLRYLQEVTFPRSE
jgi:hypothetical protein